MHSSMNGLILFILPRGVFNSVSCFLALVVCYTVVVVPIKLFVTGSHSPSLQKGSTALTMANEKGHHLIVQQLLQAGADPNLQTEVNWVGK